MWYNFLQFMNPLISSFSCTWTVYFQESFYFNELKNCLWSFSIVLINVLLDNQSNPWKLDHKEGWSEPVTQNKHISRKLDLLVFIWTAWSHPHVKEYLKVAVTLLSYSTGRVHTYAVIFYCSSLFNFLLHIQFYRFTFM